MGIRNVEAMLHHASSESDFTFALAEAERMIKNRDVDLRHPSSLVTLRLERLVHAFNPNNFRNSAARGNARVALEKLEAFIKQTF